MGNVGDKKPAKPKKLERAPTPVELDDVERYLADAAGDGKKLASGLKGAAAALEDIRNSGLTAEALIVLVTAKTRADKNGNATSAVTVQRVLEGLFRLDEFLA